MLRPWISTNLAVTADGKISRIGRQPSGWSSTADHARLLDLRKNADALLVGRGTLEADRMTLHAPGHPNPPLRCVASRAGAFDPGHPLFHSAGAPIHLLITDGSGSQAPHPLTASTTIHHGDLPGFLHTLASSHGVKTLHCEGGGEMIRSLAELDAIDEFHLTLCGHSIFGGNAAPTATGIPAGFLPESLEFGISHFEPMPDAAECFLSYRRIGRQPENQ